MQLIWLPALIVALLLASCGRGADTTPASFGKPCATDGDCIAPFTCIGAQASPHSCSKACGSDSDCPRYHWSPPCAPSIDADVQSHCDRGVCLAYIACQSSATDAAATDAP